MSFYDKMKNYPYFVFDRYYPNRYEMDKGVETDGVLVGRYVYIDYTLKNNADYNANIDIEHYKIPQNGRTNHQTVWQKTWINNKLEYRLIAEFQPNEDKPGLNLVPFAPSFLPNAQKLQTQMIYNGLGNGYTLRWQDPYQMRFRGLYDEHGNPIDFANIKGFDIKESHKVDGLNKFDVSTEESGTLYYEETADGGRMTTKPDTLVFDIALPGIGNAVSDLYDILLAQDRELIKTLDELEELINENQVTEDYQKYIYIDKNNPTALRRLVKTDDDEWVTEEFLVLDLPLLSTDGTRMNSALSLIKNLYDRYREVEESKVFLTQMQVMNMIQPFSEDWVSDDFIGPVFMLGLEDAATVCEGTCEFDGTNKVHNITLLGNLKPNQKVGSVILRACKTFTKGEKISLIADELADTATKGLLANMTNLSLYAQNNTEAENNIFWYGAVLTLNYDLENKKVYICSTEAEKNTEDEPTEHVHTLVHYEAVDATCTEEGNIEYWRCTSCGKYYSDAAGLNEITENSVIIDMIEHTYGGWSELNDDEHIRTCSVCGDTETQSHSTKYGYNKDGHWESCTICSWSGDIEQHMESTIWTSDGDDHEKLCTACNYVMDSHAASFLNYVGSDYQYHTYECTDCDLRSENTHDFKYTPVGDESHLITCNVCEADLGSENCTPDPRNPSICLWCKGPVTHTHTWGEWSINNGEEDVEHVRTCLTCNAVDYHAESFLDYVEADEQYHTYKCTDCNIHQTVEHDFKYTPVGDESHLITCNVCEADLGSENCTPDPRNPSICLWCKGPVTHEYVGQSCTEQGVCACGDTIPALGHDWIAATCTEPKTCDRCGAIEGEALGHDYIEYDEEAKPTCTEAGFIHYECANCGDSDDREVAPATGHNWVLYDEDLLEYHCSNCGAVEFGDPA